MMVVFPNQRTSEIHNEIIEAVNGELTEEDFVLTTGLSTRKYALIDYIRKS